MTTARIRAERGTQRTCKGWPQEAALRMLHNNLDPEVAEHPEDLVVYGGTGQGGTGLALVLCHRVGAAFSGGRRDLAGPVRPAGRRLSDPRMGAAAC